MTWSGDFGAKMESGLEVVFGGAFGTTVEPVELARTVVKEMEDHRVISVSRLYVPNEYTIYLSPADREQFDSYEESLLVELQDYLAENARREKCIVLCPPKVRMETDEDLDVGGSGSRPDGGAAAEAGRRASAGGRAWSDDGLQTSLRLTGGRLSGGSASSARSRR
jgi:hypothetical protein